MATSTTTTLTDFLLARIAEDEEVANATRDAVDPLDWTPGRGLSGPVDGPSGCASVVIDPARVLAECEAKRRIVESYVEEYGPEVVRVDHDTLRALAAVYADHEDYRDEWRP